jgi:tRNA (cytidine/uridine-2'-O-)-methyltransferase
MDYWHRLGLTVHDDDAAFLTAMHNRRLWLFDSRAQHSLWDVAFAPADVLLFGSETRGLDQSLLSAHAARTVGIPQIAGERCLNLSTSVGIVVYEALRQVIKGLRPKDSSPEPI